MGLVWLQSGSGVVQSVNTQTLRNQPESGLRNSLTIKSKERVTLYMQNYKNVQTEPT